MADERKFADAESLRPVVRAAFGTSRSLSSAQRLAGGSKKGAYRLTLDDGRTVLLYAWDAAEDYWHGVLPQGADDPADPFSHASGLALFEAAARRLTSAGVRCPELLLTDRSRDLYPADIAVVEDVAGGSLEALLEEDPVAAERPLSVLARLADRHGGCAFPVIREGGVHRRGRSFSRCLVRERHAGPGASPALRDRGA